MPMPAKARTAPSLGRPERDVKWHIRPEALARASASRRRCIRESSIRLIVKNLFGRKVRYQGLAKRQLHVPNPGLVGPDTGQTRKLDAKPGFSLKVRKKWTKSAREAKRMVFASHHFQGLASLRMAGRPGPHGKRRILQRCPKFGVSSIPV
jgi:hypothetical protein